MLSLTPRRLFHLSSKARGQESISSLPLATKQYRASSISTTSSLSSPKRPLSVPGLDLDKLREQIKSRPSLPLSFEGQAEAYSKKVPGSIVPATSSEDAACTSCVVETWRAHCDKNSQAWTLTGNLRENICSLLSRLSPDRQWEELKRLSSGFMGGPFAVPRPQATPCPHFSEFSIQDLPLLDLPTAVRSQNPAIGDTEALSVEFLSISVDTAVLLLSDSRRGPGAPSEVGNPRWKLVVKLYQLLPTGVSKLLAESNCYRRFEDVGFKQVPRCYGLIDWDNIRSSVISRAVDEELTLSLWQGAPCVGLVLEFAEGYCLDSSSASLEDVNELLEAVAGLHRAGVIHSNNNFRNFVFTEDGIKVISFSSSTCLKHQTPFAQGCMTKELLAIWNRLSPHLAVQHILGIGPESVTPKRER